MTTATVHPTLTSDLAAGPALVSELPPAAAARPTLLARLREELAARREARSFERAVRYAGPGELGDLMALRRRS